MILTLITFSNFFIFFVALCLIAILGFRKDNMDMISIIRPRKNKPNPKNDSIPPEDQNL